MRSYVIAFMIALLPLRGWVGDAMAGEMVRGPIQAAAQAGASHHHCDMHGVGAALAPAHDTGAGQDACSACQACHTLALEASIDSACLAASTHVLVGASAFNFASADRVLSVEPPIV